MREGIGSVFLYNMIIIFIIIVFGLLTATTSYYKAFKVNNRILASIEKFEGYNDLAQNEIEDFLSSIGYTVDANGQRECAATNKGGNVQRAKNAGHLYCVYYHADDRGANEKKEKNGDNQPIYYNYSVVSYIYVQLPIVGSFKLPVYTKGERTYNFSEGDVVK